MSDFIHVQPTRECRVAFARWAVAQNPKVRTVSPHTFAVAPHLFTEAPEDILIGSLVDGHRYISPDETGTPDPDDATATEGSDLVGFVTTEDLTDYVHQELEAIPGQPLPELPPEAYGPDSTPLDVAPADASEPDDADGQGLDELEAVGDGPPYACASCSRSFTTTRGRDRHTGRAHSEKEKRRAR